MMMTIIVVVKAFADRHNLKIAAPEVTAKFVDGAGFLSRPVCLLASESSLGRDEGFAVMKDAQP